MIKNDNEVRTLLQKLL